MHFPPATSGEDVLIIKKRRDVETQYRILRYNPDALEPTLVYEGPTQYTDESMLSWRDTDLSFDIWSELAFWRQEEKPRFVMEVMKPDGTWRELGTFDNETLRCPSSA